jgi:hypothetical protein
MTDHTAVIREALEGARDQLWNDAGADHTGDKYLRLSGECKSALAALEGLERERASVVAEIAAERRRQIDDEGWTPERDDIIHADGGLALAAMGYCQSASTGMADTSQFADHPPAYWPWDPQWWKPTSRRRDLLKAAALIVAEIERLDRAALKEDQ